MNTKILTRRKILWLLLSGLGAGFVNGLLGAGGGIIVVFAMSKLLSEQITHKNDAFANALCVMLPISILSGIMYYSRGNISLDGFGIFIPGAVIGGLAGGLLIGKVGAVSLKRLFCGLIVLSGILLIVR